MASREDSITEYWQALLGLHEVNEPHITFLTILAMQHAQHAYDIVCAIETHIEMVKPNAKLPAIYLIDSIVRHLPQSPYKFLLKKNIIHTFTSVFEKVDRTTRQDLFNVRQSWVGVFPNNKLYSLDWKINTHLDPSWPITAIAPEHGSSHADPRCPQLRQQRHWFILYVDDTKQINGIQLLFLKPLVDMKISSLNIIKSWVICVKVFFQYFLRKEMMIIILITAFVLMIIQQS
ncbi:hypothetical protein ACJMK2_000818 [Sinanodonta woodiana]|uniref:CID domain-containing protein n=1 Tax=Sinanodonta woodiana TaxID=1069815 RepID=A0ABD3XS97_SINWO